MRQWRRDMPKRYERLNDPHGPAKKKIAKPSHKRRAHHVRGPPNVDQIRGQELISYDELLLLYGIRYGRKQLARLIEAKQFPQPVKIGAKRIAFVREEIVAWLEARKAERAA
jgi:predicted DNA-binding transcriptional regulator AlpA